MAPVPGEATAMEVSFTPATPVAAAVGASVEGGAARAATGSPQESEDASVLVQVPAGRTALPDLVRVVRSADGSGRPVVTFVFDQALPPAYQEGPPPGADFSLYDGDGRRHGARGRGTVGGGGAEVTFGIPSVDEAVLATAVVGAVDDVGGDAPTFPEGCAPLT